MSSKDDVLIIEDSPAIGMLLKNYLEKLGYTHIHTCINGSAAIETFKEFVTLGKHPIVLLDYMLPDMDARSILTQMLEVQPNARVVLETATEKDDEGIKELIRLGVYQYLEKPIRFENLKSIFETIEKEQSFFEKESEQVKMLKEAAENDQIKLYDHIDFILKSAKQISLNFIEQLLGFSDESIILHLNELEKQGKIITLGDKKEIACNQCDSVKTTQIFYCPSCKNSNFRLGKLVEHYDCGNISEESTYKNDKCPNCDKEIKALGVDYRLMLNHYICNNCSEFFPEISTYYLCLKCENKFKLEEGRWKSSKNFKVVNI
ncbi:MAG: response regulator [Nitrosarchaeum sp.]|nr:MAG: response regulator [Nitrosarchaeum sp.]